MCHAFCVTHKKDGITHPKDQMNMLPTKAMIDISTMKNTAYGMTLDNSEESSPCLSTLLNAMAMDCGEIILPAATPSELRPTIQ